jgi:hypothetical protein
MYGMVYIDKYQNYDSKILTKMNYNMERME